MISGAFTLTALFRNRRLVLGQLECFLRVILYSHSLLQAGCTLHCGAASWQWQQWQNESHTLQNPEWTNEGGRLWRQKNIRIVRIGRWSSGACCQAAHIGSGCWVGCLPTNEPLQGRSWDRQLQVSSARPLCSTSQFDYCVHTCANELSQKGNAPSFQNNIMTDNHDFFARALTPVCWGFF